MRMAGFTAEAAVNKATRPYVQVLRSPGMAPGGSVVAQRIKLRDWECECDPATDVCVCRSGGIVRVIHATLGSMDYP